MNRTLRGERVGQGSSHSHDNTTVLSWYGDLKEITVEIEKNDVRDIEQEAKNSGYRRISRNDKNTYTYPASITFQKV